MLAAQLGYRHPAIGLPLDRMICATVYLPVFIRNLLMHLAEKILLTQPLTFGGITQGELVMDKVQRPARIGPRLDQGRGSCADGFAARFAFTDG